MTSYLWKLTYTTIHLYYNYISMNYFNLTRKFTLATYRYVLLLALKRVSQQLLLSSVSKWLLAKWKYANISNNILFDTMMQNLELISQCLIDSLFLVVENQTVQSSYGYFFGTSESLSASVLWHYWDRKSFDLCVWVRSRRSSRPVHKEWKVMFTMTYNGWHRLYFEL